MPGKNPREVGKFSLSFRLLMGLKQMQLHENGLEHDPHSVCEMGADDQSDYQAWLAEEKKAA